MTYRINMKNGKTRTQLVDCGTCTLCCRNDAIVLHPEDGDDPTQYKTINAVHPFSGKPIQMLAKGPDGNCIYMGEGGCTIYERRPAVCRSFSCAALYERYGAKQCQKMIEQGTVNKEVVDMGRKKLKSMH